MFKIYNIMHVSNIFLQNFVAFSEYIFINFNPKGCGLFGLLDMRRGADSARIEKT